MKTIKIGEIFEVDGKKYTIINPQKLEQETNEHGQIVILLTELTYH
jgi:hypothetical protein